MSSPAVSRTRWWVRQLRKTGRRPLAFPARPPAQRPTFVGRVRLFQDEPRQAVAEMTETLQRDVNERAKVESWRLHVLMEAGYPIALAERLAASEADLHRAVKLVEQGCSHETAA